MSITILKKNKLNNFSRGLARSIDITGSYNRKFIEKQLEKSLNEKYIESLTRDWEELGTELKETVVFHERRIEKK